MKIKYLAFYIVMIKQRKPKSDNKWRKTKGINESPMQINIDSGKCDKGSVGLSQIMSLDLVCRKFLKVDSYKEVTNLLFHSNNRLASTIAKSE